MSTARRIQIGILVIVFTVMSAAGAAVLFTVRAQLVGQVDAQLEAAADTLARTADLDVDAQIELLRTVAEQPDRASALLVFGPDDALLLSVPSGIGDDGDPLPDIGIVGVDGLRMRAGDPFQLAAVAGSTHYRVVAIDLDQTVLVIATPLDDVRATLARLTLTLLIAAIAGVVVIGVATSIVIRRAISPIDEMIDVAAAIGRGDLAQRIETTSHDDDVKRLSGALNDMLHQLEDAFRDKDEAVEQLRRFVADASHELRTPLASIRGYAELYTTGAATDSDAVERAMTRIQSEAIRTGALVEDLLLLARLDQGRELVVDDVDVNRLVAEAVDDAVAVDPRQQITVSVPEQPALVRGDADRLRQVVTNLLSNARNHAPGAPVTVTVERTHGGVELVVRDQGPGLTEAQADRVFDRFWRADETRNRRTGGSGLGLAIIASVVEAHGGTVDLETLPGHGAAFRAWLPKDVEPQDGRAT